MCIRDRQVDEPTMIIVYGDHQPALGDDTDEWLFGSNAGPLSMFETPFLIWTNYPIESRNVGDMSANYLPMLILETANKMCIRDSHAAAHRAFAHMEDLRFHPVLFQFGGDFR